eukprot:CAMPEP_0115129948 /NCGR_PEP_ID=MMETSP0227-20121206/52133_1 /TAXON_ID=89957 /ORGANISM="Polarella glacialis, Strain CCMP 1383" /LENGTH=90 /DNA_ID=CAMNT_0002534991 /DNA_START=1 /DNA_END=273 /DNA_ORIENTATION=+
MFKEKAWTAKFIRKQREEEAEERLKLQATDVAREKWELKAEETIMKFVNSPSSPANHRASKAPARGSSPASIRSNRSEQLVLAGAMTVEG